jgi:hypothetical protein
MRGDEDYFDYLSVVETQDDATRSHPPDGDIDDFDVIDLLHQQDESQPPDGDIDDFDVETLEILQKNSSGVRRSGRDSHAELVDSGDAYDPDRRHR